MLPRFFDDVEAAAVLLSTEPLRDILYGKQRVSDTKPNEQYLRTRYRVPDIK